MLGKLPDGDGGQSPSQFGLVPGYIDRQAPEKRTVRIAYPLVRKMRAEMLFAVRELVTWRCRAVHCGIERGSGVDVHPGAAMGAMRDTPVDLEEIRLATRRIDDEFGRKDSGDAETCREPRRGRMHLRRSEIAHRAGRPLELALDLFHRNPRYQCATPRDGGIEMNFTDDKLLKHDLPRREIVEVERGRCHKTRELTIDCALIGTYGDPFACRGMAALDHYRKTVRGDESPGVIESGDDDRCGHAHPQRRRSGADHRLVDAGPIERRIAERVGDERGQPQV